MARHGAADSRSTLQWQKHALVSIHRVPSAIFAGMLNNPWCHSSAEKTIVYTSQILLSPFPHPIISPLPSSKT
jgi:hypothetical protein